MRATFPAAVHVFLLRRRPQGGDWEVLLLLRANTGYEDGRYGVPAGHLDGGESITQAAIREAREETGVELMADDLSVVGVMHRKAEVERIEFFLAAQRWRGDARNAEPEKCDGVGWWPLDHLPENMVAYIRHALARPDGPLWFEEQGWE